MLQQGKKLFLKQSNKINYSVDGAENPAVQGKQM
jgi:hypothetical protein